MLFDKNDNNMFYLFSQARYISYEQKKSSQPYQIRTINTKNSDNFTNSQRCFHWFCYDIIRSW